MPVLSDNNNSDSDTDDNLATSEQPEPDEVLYQETAGKKKRCAKQVMSDCTEDTLIDLIRENPLLV